MTYQRNKIEDDTKSAVSNMADKAGQYASKASEKVENVIEGAESAASNLAKQGREATERVGEVAGNLQSAVDKSVRDQPMATLAVAVALGFVVGAIWKS